MTVSVVKLYAWFDVPRRTGYDKPTKATPKIDPAFAEPIKALIESKEDQKSIQWIDVPTDAPFSPLGGSRGRSCFATTIGSSSPVMICEVRGDRFTVHLSGMPVGSSHSTLVGGCDDAGGAVDLGVDL
ncbi:MAG: hypothetical protein AAF713_21735 [Pseudomonadota bacterium]